MKINFHSLQSLMRHGWKQPSTWIGIAILLGVLYHNQINSLIVKVLTSQYLVTRLIDTIASGVGILFIMYRDDHRNDDK